MGSRSSSSSALAGAGARQRRGASPPSGGQLNLAHSRNGGASVVAATTMGTRMSVVTGDHSPGGLQSLAGPGGVTSAGADGGVSESPHLRVAIKDFKIKCFYMFWAGELC